jgi:hypothetical protein
VSGHICINMYICTMFLKKLIVTLKGREAAPA